MVQITQIVPMGFLTKPAAHDIQGCTNVVKGRTADSDAERSLLRCRATIPLRPIVQTVLQIFAIKSISSCNMRAKS